MRVGMPQGLLYFKYGRHWKRCLKAIGAEVVISPETTEEILSNGIRHSVCDLCLPVKSFFGHVLALKDNVDCLFVPRMIRVEPDAYLCPKFIGLPDMVRAAIRNLPQIIDTEFNIKEKTTDRFWHEVGAELKNDKKFVISDGIFKDDFTYKSSFENSFPGLNASDKKLTIGIAGRPYLILDNHLNKGLVRYIHSLGVETSIIHSLDKNYITDTMEKLPKWVYWSMGKDIVASVRWMLENDGIDGVILMSTAGCGPDSFIAELIERTLFIEKKPYMSLKLDEHSSDVGLKTRMEAFVDMIGRGSKLKRASLEIGIKTQA